MSSLKESPAQKNLEIPPATSVLLQGNPQTCSRKVWLFPDGSGSAVSYMSLPDINAKKVAVYGLNSPFIKHTADTRAWQFSEMAASYLKEMRRRQPAGPYTVGGWSAGGLCAYTVAQMLVADGEDVDALILIDSPNPIGLKELPSRLYSELELLGMFGTQPGQKLPEWLAPHIKLFAGILNTFKADPWVSEKPLPTWALWARNGADEGNLIERLPSDPDNMFWLLNRRKKSSLSCNGWDGLLGQDNIKAHVIEGAHHFSMLKHPAGQQVSDVLRKILESSGGGL